MHENTIVNMLRNFSQTYMIRTSYLCIVSVAQDCMHVHRRRCFCHLRTSFSCKVSSDEYHFCFIFCSLDHNKRGAETVVFICACSYKH